MFTRTGEYALRAVLLLAQRPEGDVVPAETIAKELGVPANYLSKTLHRLARNGILSSSKGRHGGFRLARAPSDLSISEVVSDFEAANRDGRCVMGGGHCDVDNPCVAHAQWKQLSSEQNRLLGETTVGDFLQEETETGRVRSQPRG